MNLLVGPSPNLRGTVKAPPNKSHSFRALIMAALAEGASKITDPMVSNDWTPEDILNCGNSGIILRFFTALAACCEGYTVLTGDESLRHIRPCQPLVDALNHLGAWAVSTKGDGHAPLVVRGKLTGGRAEIDGMDSQPVSALLIASSLASSPTELTVHRPGEKPWVGMTLHWLNRCGVEVSNQEYQVYRVRGGSGWKGFDCRIPLDWSAAMYPIVAAVVTPDSEIHLPGLDPADVQGDKAVLNVLRRMGADIETVDGTIRARSSRLTGMEIDCNDFIDQFMLLAVVGACAEGRTVLTNAEICRNKECDRIRQTCQALRAMGAEVEERDDGLVIQKSLLRGARLSSAADHRMVMTLAVAAMAARNPTLITDIDCIKKTFPNFVEQMQAVGCDMQTQ